MPGPSLAAILSSTAKVQSELVVLGPRRRQPPELFKAEPSSTSRPRKRADRLIEASASTGEPNKEAGCWAACDECQKVRPNLVHA